MLQRVSFSRHAEIVPSTYTGWQAPFLLYNAPMAITDLLKLIFWVIVLILALSFFGISIQAIVSSPAGQANINYVTHVLTQVWQWIIQGWEEVVSRI